METWLIFNDGFELPSFATFPLIERDEGRDALTRYYAPYLEHARRRGVGFVLEAPTWRANPNWGAELGYSLDALAEANRRAIAFLEEIREQAALDQPVVINGSIGPEADAYNPDRRLTADQAEAYHAWQIDVLAETAADMVGALTITYPDEAIGIVRAARAAELPVSISFTVETDGRLPNGQPLADAIEQVETETDGAAAYFMVNCAHPTHVLPTLDVGGPWQRILGIRANASKKSHAELDEAEELDDGDPVEFGEDHRAIQERLPHLTVLGGCCGTDHRHVGHALTAWLER
jgi:homocysteine S-methyltransferase